MSESNSDTTVIRAYEKMIDEGYRNSAILSRPLEVALYGLLAVYDGHIVTQHMVHEANDGSPISPGQVQQFKYRTEGLVWAVRWLLEKRRVPDVQPVPEKDVIEEASELVEYGGKYFTIGMMYSQFSRGTATATVNETAKSIRFNFTPEYRRAGCSWGFYDDVSKENHARQARASCRWPSLKAASQVAFLKTKHHLENGRIVLDDVASLAAPDVQNWCREMCDFQHVFPPERDLNGFTMGDFNLFWQAILSWSECLKELYLAMWKAKLPQSFCMPTQAVDREQFIVGCTTLSGLDSQIVVKIVERLSYDWRTKNPDIFLQPLLVGKTTIAWSPGVILMSRFQRNILKLMARTPADKFVADNVIGDREQSLLRDFRQIIDAKGWSVALNTKIDDGDEAEIDLLASNWRCPQEVLIVEGKAFLQVDDSNEIKSATEEMQKAQEQVTRGIQLLTKMPIEKRRRFFPKVEWDKVKHLYGVVVTPESEPGINFDHSIVPAASLQTLNAQLKRKDWESPYRIWRTMTQRSWQASFRDAEFDYEPVSLAGVTFELPFMSIEQ